MTRDNLLFVTIGVLAGFISGYFTHEVMAVRQPPPLAVLQAAQAAAMGNPHQGDAAAAGGGAAPAAAGAEPAGAAGAAGPAMADIQRLREQVEKNPNDADAILTLANLNYDIRNWERSRELYERYLQLRPPHPDVLTDLGVSLRGLRRFPEALARFEEAQRLQDGHWQSLYNSVVVLAFDLGDVPKAKQLLGRLRQLQPDNPEVARLVDEVAKRGGSA
jgi:tetratricopeptide (TPR) repeat protein